MQYMLIGLLILLIGTGLYTPRVESILLPLNAHMLSHLVIHTVVGSLTVVTSDLVW